MSHPVAQRVRRAGPKRILALDGGGLRGVVTLAFLKRIEWLLAKQYPDNRDFRLRDHFDLIGGTSTGSIIATSLALGWTVDKIRASYRDLGRQVFRHRPWRYGIFKSRFSHKAFDQCLEPLFGHATLGSRDITCGLAIVTKRLDTDSVWVFHNNPFGPYYDHPSGHVSGATPNKDIPVYRIVRASIAAPTYIAPAFIEVAAGHAGFFVDGAVSPFASPALLLYLVATVPAYGYGWQAGEEQLQLVSIGTGSPRRVRYDPRLLRRLPSTVLGAVGLHSIMKDCERLGHMVLQSMAAVRTPWIVDREAGALDYDKPVGTRRLSYARFELALDADWLEAELGVRLPVKEVETLRSMDNPDTMDTLYELGTAAAERQVRPESLAFAAGAQAG